MTIAEYSRPTRLPLNQVTSIGHLTIIYSYYQVANQISNSPVRVSFLSIPIHNVGDGDDTSVVLASEEQSPKYVERICFNVGREIYVYDYGGVNGAADLSKPIDKRVYKGTFPTCHDFNQENATVSSCLLIIGFSAGQIQQIDPYQKEYQTSRLYNEERIIDKSAVTCLKWVPSTSLSCHLFIAPDWIRFQHSQNNLSPLTAVVISTSTTRNTNASQHRQFTS